MSEFKYIRLDKITPPEFDARLSGDTEADDELRDSIRENGILEPIIVKNIGGKFEIVCGNRRFQQAGRAGLAAAPCIITDATGAALDTIKIHENLKRLDLSHVDQAYTFAHLIKEYKMTETQVAVLVGKSIAYVSQHLSLLRCDELLIQAVHNGSLVFSVARELAQCKDKDERNRLMNIIIEHGATSPVVHSWVQEANRESDILERDHKEQKQQLPHTPTPEPHYPCAVCETPTRYDKIRSIRMCPGCFNLFFLELEQGRLNERTKTTPGSSETASG